MELLKSGLHFLLFICLVYVEGTDIRGFDDSILFNIEWPGIDAEDVLQSNKGEVVVMKSNNDEKYACQLPEFQEKEKDPIENYEGPNPLELLAPVFTINSPCAYRLESYWTYELCHGRHVRQYHEEREGKKVKQQEFYLGRLDKEGIQEVFDELDALSKDSKLASIPVKKIDGLTMPYLQINMTDGTVCDLTQKPRITKVLYVCYQHGKNEISSLKETSSCEYEIIVLSPQLCKHPKYKNKLISNHPNWLSVSTRKDETLYVPSIQDFNRPQESGENIISCLPFTGSPTKPGNLLALEAESLKLRHQKLQNQDGNFKQVYAVVSIDRDGESQDGETRVRVEFHPIDTDEPDPASPQPPMSSPSASPPPDDTSPVSSFLLGKNCLSGGSGWWRYEFCYGQSVDQYHVENDGSKIIINLGKFDKQKHLEWIDNFPHKRPKPVGQRKQISHFYSGGSMCDKTNKPRQTEVKLKCLEGHSSQSTVTLFLIEPKTCEYVLVVESPLICNILDRADENGLINITEEEFADEVTVSEEEDTYHSESPSDEISDNTIPNGDE